MLGNKHGDVSGYQLTTKSDFSAVLLQSRLNLEAYRLLSCGSCVKSMLLLWQLHLLDEILPTHASYLRLHKTSRSADSESLLWSCMSATYQVVVKVSFPPASLGTMAAGRVTMTANAMDFIQKILCHCQACIAHLECTWIHNTDADDKQATPESLTTVG